VTLVPSLERGHRSLKTCLYVPNIEVYNLWWWIEYSTNMTTDERTIFAKLEALKEIR